MTSNVERVSGTTTIIDRATVPTGPFDKQALYEAEIRPIIEKLTEICHREQLSFNVAVCFMGGNDQKGVVADSTAYGEDRTPLEMVFASMLMEEGFMHTFRIMGKFAMGQMVDQMRMRAEAAQEQAEADAATKQ